MSMFVSHSSLRLNMRIKCFYLCPGWFLRSYEIAIVIVFIRLIEVVILKITKLTRLVLLLLILRILVEKGSFKCICWILVLLIILYLTQDYETYMQSYDDVHNSIADFTIACENTIVGRLRGRFAFFFVTAISETFFLAGAAFFTSLNNEYESYWMIKYVNDRQLFNNVRRFTSGALRSSVPVGKPYASISYLR